MPRRKQQRHRPIGEDTRIAVNLTVKKLLETPDQKELEFPSSYTAEERAYIHELARELGLKSKSRGYMITFIEYNNYFTFFFNRVILIVSFILQERYESILDSI